MILRNILVMSDSVGINMNLAEQMNLKKTGSRQELIDRILESAENADTVFEDDDMPDMIPADPE